MRFICQIHPKKLLNLICIDENCLKKGKKCLSSHKLSYIILDLICEICKEDHHIDHFVISHENFLSKIFTEMKQIKQTDSESSILFDIKKNTEILKRYITEIKTMENEFFDIIQKNFELLNSQISEEENKIFDSIQQYNPHNLFSFLTKATNIEEYKEIIKKLQFSVTTIKDSSWSFDYENVYLKKKEEIHQMENSMKKFRKFFQENLQSFKKNLRKTFDLDTFTLNLHENSKINHLKQQPIIIESQTNTILNTVQEPISQSILDTILIQEQKPLSIADRTTESKEIRIKKNFFRYEGLLDEKIYKGSKEIHCCFCESSSLERELFKKLGNLYGPYLINNNKEEVYFHEMCVLWSNEIEMHADKTISQFEDVIKKSEKNFCYNCRKKGASMVCLKSNCKNVCHFKCVIEKKAGVINYQKIGFYCKKHFKKISEMDKKMNKNKEKMSLNSKKIQKKEIN